MTRSKRALVYSCSGCSSAAQMANALAVRLDREGRAEMSCIAGVGGDVKGLVRVATSGRPIIAIDGCPLSCVQACLARHRLRPDVHMLLNELGVKKTKHRDFDADQADVAYRKLLETAAALLVEELPETQERPHLPSKGAAFPTDG